MCISLVSVELMSTHRFSQRITSLLPPVDALSSLVLLKPTLPGKASISNFKGDIRKNIELIPLMIGKVSCQLLNFTSQLFGIQVIGVQYSYTLGHLNYRQLLVNFA